MDQKGKRESSMRPSGRLWKHVDGEIQAGDKGAPVPMIVPSSRHIIVQTLQLVDSKRSGQLGRAQVVALAHKEKARICLWMGLLELRPIAALPNPAMGSQAPSGIRQSGI